MEAERNEDLYDAELQAIVNQLIHAYYLQKAKKEQKPYREPQIDMKKRLAWIKVAKVVRQLGAVPSVYIAAQFAISKSPVFASALHGPVAQNRYKRYATEQMYHGITITEDKKEEQELSRYPIATRLKQDIAATYRSLQYHCGSMDLDDPGVLHKAIEIQLHFDPVCMMLLCPTPEIKKVFGNRARRQLEDTPGLREAAIQSGFDIAIEYLEEEDEDE